MTFSTARIAVLEARMSSEMADLIRRNGGEAMRIPAVREVPIDSGAEVAAFLDHLTAGSLRTVVFFTGVGATALFTEAERLGRLPELLTALRASTVVCRGPKPSAVLRRQNVPIAYSAREPYTSNELLDELAPQDLAGTTVGVVHYGERDAHFAQALSHQGAALEELCLYKWLLPEETAPLYQLVRDILDGRIDAIVFTSQIQVRHLFQIAAELHVAEGLTLALNTKTIVASIGPTCTGVLQSYGVTPHVIPEHPKMGYLVKALAEYMV